MTLSQMAALTASAGEPSGPSREAFSYASSPWNAPIHASMSSSNTSGSSCEFSEKKIRHAKRSTVSRVTHAAVSLALVAAASAVAASVVSAKTGRAKPSSAYFSSLYSSSDLYAWRYFLKMVFAVVSTPATVAQSLCAPGAPSLVMSSGSRPGHRSGKSAAETMESASPSCARASLGAPSMRPTSNVRTWSFSASPTRYGAGAPTTSGSSAGFQCFFTRFLNATAPATRAGASAASLATSFSSKMEKPPCCAPLARNCSAFWRVAASGDNDALRHCANCASCEASSLIVPRAIRDSVRPDAVRPPIEGRSDGCRYTKIYARTKKADTRLVAPRVSAPRL